MPQLATESFFSQYFWLLVTLCLFHYVIVTLVIPHISLTMKARKFQADSVVSSSQSDSVVSRDLLLSSHLGLLGSFIENAAGTSVEIPLSMSTVEEGLKPAITTAFKS